MSYQQLLFRTLGYIYFAWALCTHLKYCSLLSVFWFVLLAYEDATYILLSPKVSHVLHMFAFRSFCPLKKATDFLLRWAAHHLCTSSCSTAGRRKETTGQNLLTSSASLTNWSATPALFTHWWRTFLCKMHNVGTFPPDDQNVFQATGKKSREREPTCPSCCPIVDRL